LGEEGVVGEAIPDDELVAPPAELEAAAPVPPAVVLVSALVDGAGVGVGAGVGAAVVDGGGVTSVVFSSFLHAVTASAIMAAMRSERVMLYPFEQVL
jgi:hypothetical protein